AKQPQAAPQPKPTPPAVPSNQPSVQLDTSETLFAVLAAMNVCGYDEELGFSDPLREQIRGEVSQAIQQSEEAKETATAMCQFYERHRQAYSALTARYHEPLSKTVFDTEVYLKFPSAAYLGRQFTVYIDPMGAPGQTNARNYGSDYYVVISPGKGSSLKVEQIRHTY